MRTAEKNTKPVITISVRKTPGPTRQIELPSLIFRRLADHEVDAEVVALLNREAEAQGYTPKQIDEFVDGERWQAIDHLDLLQRGFAIDGDRAILSVTPQTRFFVGGTMSGWGCTDAEILGDDEWSFGNVQAENFVGCTPEPLAEVLQIVEETLVAWLDLLGYAVKFEGAGS